MTCEAIHPVPGSSLKHGQNRQLEIKPVAQDRGMHCRKSPAQRW